jgi:murein DD-endopeptidase MepM/ murein hydrolase activator NlpD
MSCVRNCIVISLGVLAAVACQAASIRQLSLGSAADQPSCTIAHARNSFDVNDRQVFVHFVADRIRAGDRLTIEWVDSAGTVAANAPYEDLPGASSLCFLSQLPVAGFPPASEPGRWSVRIVLNGRPIASRDFRIAEEAAAGGPHVASVVRRPAGEHEIELVIDGSGFNSGSVVHLAQFTKSGGWRYIQAMLPTAAHDNQVVVQCADLPPAEYIVVVRNPDDRLSNPARVLVASGGYKLPFPAGEEWVITQGPYGSFSHWNNTLHAYDIAPLSSGRYVVAMRAGTAYTHDLGMGQTHTRRSFGNYITIDHGDGEYSQYAHLATGTFVVKNGQYVVQGQPLARVGNSGYTLGEGGGVHVHVEVTRSLAISSQSVPFRFEDLPAARGGPFRGPVISGNTPPSGEAGMIPVAARTAAPPAARTAAPPAARPFKQFDGSVGVSQWWTDLIRVTPGVRNLTVALGWNDADSDLDLHLVSPSGRHYGWYGDTTGYSGARSRPERFELHDPEPGMWRVSVQAMQGPPGSIPFTVDAFASPPERQGRYRRVAARRHR